jgi:hypothetical protein
MAGQPPLMRFTLQTSDETLVLNLSPDGYREFSDEWNFSTSPFGFNEKTNSQTLRFVKEGADFLRKQLDLYGISADVNLIVERRKNDWTYETTFEGRLDFNSPYMNERDFFEVKAFEGGMKQALVEKNKTNFEIPLSDTDAVDIEVPEGMDFYESVSYDFPNSKHGVKLDIPIARGSRGKYFIETELKDAVIKTKNIIFQSQKILLNYNDEHSSDPESPFLIIKSDNNRTFQVKLDFSFKMLFYGRVSTSAPIYVRISGRPVGTTEYTKTITLFEIPAYYFHKSGDTSMANGKTFSQTTYFNIEMLNNDMEYFIYCDVEQSGAASYNPAYITAIGSCSMSFFGGANTGAFSFKAFKAEAFATKLMKEIHAPATCQIPFLQQMEQQGMQLFLTSGDGIRGIPEALVKTNFSDFIKNMNCLFDIGVRPNNKENEYYVVEKGNVLDRNNELLNLGRVQEIKIEPLDENWMFNGVKIGYEKQEYDNPLGRQDFAATLEFTNELKIPNKILDLVSKYRADYTGVHLLHYDYVNSDKTDSKSDNDVFWILAFLKDGKWQAVKGDYVVLGSESLEGGGYFNILLSPHRNLRRHKNYMKSILDKHEEVLKYTASTETQTDIFSIHYISNLIDEVQEKTDENVSSGEILFKPFTFEFDCIVPRNLAQSLGDSPSGYFRFQYNNIELKGFPIKVSGSYTDSKQTVTCLAHPDTPGNIQRLLFAKQSIIQTNEMKINASWITDDTAVTVSAQFPVNSDLTVSVKSEASYDNGVTWEDDAIGGTLNFTIHVGETTAHIENISNPFEYNKRRFTILSITPEKDIEFKYVAGGQVVV